MADNNPAGLIISGKPDHKILEITWHVILEQYQDAMGDSEAKLYLNLYREVLRLSLTIQQIVSLVETMRYFYADELKSELNAIARQRCQFDTNDHEQYEKDLERCLAKEIELSLRCDLKKAELEVIEKKQKGNAAPVIIREYFQNILITLSDNSQYQVRDDITVYEFIERVRRLLKLKKNASFRR